MPDKMEKVMDEYKTGALRSGSKLGPKVTSRKQAIAIGISEAKKAGQYKTPKSAASAKSALKKRL